MLSCIVLLVCRSDLWVRRTRETKSAEETTTFVNACFPLLFARACKEKQRFSGVSRALSFSAASLPLPHTNHDEQLHSTAEA